MKWLNGYRIRLVLFGFVAAIVLGGGSAKADLTFGTPTNLGPVVNSAFTDYDPTISSDGLSFYFHSTRPGGLGQEDIWVTTRPTVSDAWGPPVNLGPIVNSSSRDMTPSISFDGLSLYFFSNLSGGYAIWVTTRPSLDAQWGRPVNLGPPVNSTGYELFPSISADGLSLLLVRFKFQNHEGIYVSTRATKDSPWGPPVELGLSVNSADCEHGPYITADGLALFFHRWPLWPPGEIWLSKRTCTTSDWGDPVKLGPSINTPVKIAPSVNTTASEESPSVSADGSILYFCSTRPGGLGGYDLWQAPIIPIVDFNGDEKLDLKDFSRLAQYWGQNESSVDMGPMPWGDGIVNLKDLFVFSEYWLSEVTDPRLIAYWKLDETEGTIAYENVGDKDGTLNGDAIWQPMGGKVNGALQFDGIDDYVITPFILDPAAGAFSIFAWVKGGAPAQVIISQTGGANWLSASPTEGKLMTELKAAGRYGTPLFSETVIIDGQWHRVGLTWDGSTRTLFVDNVEVAKGTQSTLAGSAGGLYIGAGSAGRGEPGSFWSGLIDDVRIYDRAVSP